MAVQKKLQVFVSSTYTDMLAERRAVVDAILRSEHIPAGMEQFAAGDESQWETIRQWIDDSDIFMLVLGGRYGSIEQKSGKSYIELEYDYAIKKKKPFFAAVISEPFLTAKVKENGPDAMERENGRLLKDFRERVRSKICRFFNDINELKVIVFESIGRISQKEELQGWVRGSDVVDPKPLLEDANRLRLVNEHLQMMLSAKEAELGDLRARSNRGALLLEDSAQTTLSDDAKKLLIEAKSSDGRIMYLQYLGGAGLQAGGREFLSPYSDREEARWRAALKELRNERLIEDVGYDGSSFRMTMLGYEVADKIEKEDESADSSPPASTE
jgi:hypothetical protein